MKNQMICFAVFTMCAITPINAYGTYHRLKVGYPARIVEKLNEINSLTITCKYIFTQAYGHNERGKNNSELIQLSYLACVTYEFYLILKLYLCSFHVHYRQCCITAPEQVFYL